VKSFVFVGHKFRGFPNKMNLVDIWSNLWISSL